MTIRVLLKINLRRSTVRCPYAVPSGLDTRRESKPAVLFGMLLLALLLSVCGCVHPRSTPAVVRQNPAVCPPSHPSESSLDIALVTYNIWGLPGWLNGASPRRYNRIAQELQRQDPDFIFLQEVWFGRAYEALPKGGTWSVAYAPRHPWFCRPSGLVALSRFPILSGEFHQFRSQAWPDSLVQKGALKITVDLGEGRRLNLWNVHLQAGSKRRVRNRQIVELSEWVHQAKDDQIADVIAGDFNCTPDSQQYRQLAQLLGPDAQTFSHQQHFPTYDGLSPNPDRAQTVDYVFIRLRAPVLSIRANPQVTFNADWRANRLSDHMGIHVDVNLELSTAPDGLSAFESLAWAPNRAFLPLIDSVGD